MSEPFPPEIKTRLIRAWSAAEARGRTHQELANYFKTSISAVGQWFNPGKRGVSIGRIADLCRLLDVNVEWLLSGQGEAERGQDMTEEDLVLLRKWKNLNEVDRRRVVKFMDGLLDDYSGTERPFQKGA